MSEEDLKPHSTPYVSGIDLRTRSPGTRMYRSQYIGLEHLPCGGSTLLGSWYSGRLDQHKQRSW